MSHAQSWKLTRLESRIAPAVFTEVEPNNTFGGANSVTVPTGSIVSSLPDVWLEIQGSISQTGDRDYYSFSLAKAAGVFFDVDARDAGITTTLNSLIEIFTADGFNVPGAANDDGYDFDAFVAPTTPTPLAISLDSSLFVSLPAGAYVARIRGSGDVTIGAYQLRILADESTSTNSPNWHSQPGAQSVLLLDFDGHAATDEWGTYAVSPFDLDGLPAIWDPREQLAAKNLYRIVAEDFASWSVDVTTQAPDPSFTGAVYRLVVTNSGSTAVPTLAGGLRSAVMQGGFLVDGGRTGFVFASAFGDYGDNGSGRAVATPLELGNEVSATAARGLGLKNYGGLNSRPSAILQMPSGGLRRAVWTQGPTHSGELPVVTQSDLVALGGVLAPRIDDHGGTNFSATDLPSGTLTEVGGVIETTGDVDVFRFSAGAGLMACQLIVDPYFGNLDAQIVLTSSTGEIVAESAPTDRFGAGFTSTLPAGVYYLSVRSQSGSGTVGSYRLRLLSGVVNAPPQIQAFFVNDGTPQRSMVTSLTVIFSTVVTLPANPLDAFTLQDSLAFVPMTASVSNGVNTSVVFTFPPGSSDSGSLRDGRYSLVVTANLVHDLNGAALDGDVDGVAGGNAFYFIHRLFGDGNGDAKVDSFDFIAFRSTFGLVSTQPGYFAHFDSNGDGKIDSLDFIAFRGRFNTILP